MCVLERQFVMEHEFLRDIVCISLLLAGLVCKGESYHIISHFKW